jgi:hypothetical protein
MQLHKIIYRVKNFEIEGLKLLYDFFKHLATASSGILLLIIAFFDKIFEAPVYRVETLAFIFSGLILAILASTGVMSLIIAKTLNGGKVLRKWARISIWSMSICAILAFCVSLFLLSMVSLVNLRETPSPPKFQSPVTVSPDTLK